MQEKLLETLPPQSRVDQQLKAREGATPDALNPNVMTKSIQPRIEMPLENTLESPEDDLIQAIDQSPSLFRRVFEFFMSLQPQEVEQKLQEEETPPVQQRETTPVQQRETPPREEGNFLTNLAQGNGFRNPRADGGKLDDQMGVLISVEPSKSMVPDEQMEEDYIEYVISNSLSPEEETYLLNKLEQDDELSLLFDKVIETASEFSGTGPVEGPGSEKSDSIPARLSDGEFVFTAKAVEEIGADNLQLMMEDAERASGDRQQAAYGGSVESMTRRNQASKSLLYKDDADDEIKKAMLSINPRMQ